MLKRLVSWVFLLPLCFVLILFGLSNRQIVTINFDPLTQTAPLVPPLSLPLFFVMFGFLIFGVLLGGLATWFSQGKQRKEKRRWRREATRLEKEAQVTKSNATAADLQLQQSFD